MGVDAIQQYSASGRSYPCEDGGYVLYDDHAAVLDEKEASLAAEKEKVRELVEVLGPINDYFRKEHWPNHPLRMKIEALIAKYSKEQP